MNFKQMLNLYKDVLSDLPDALYTIWFLVATPFVMPFALIYNRFKKK